MPDLPAHFTLLQVTPELETGGAEQTTIDVAHAVVAQGGKALVATRGGRMATRLEADGGRLAQMPAQSKNPLVMLGNAARLIDLIRREKVSLVHARSRAPAFSALWAAHATKVPFVATYHGVYNAKSGLKRWYNAVMTKGAVVIANSEYTREHVIREHGVAADKVVAIPRGVDLSRFEPDVVSADRIEALRQAWGVAPDERRLKVLLAGRLTRWKGQGLLVQAMALLKARGEDKVLLLLAGDDQGRKGYRAELAAAIAQAGLEDAVKLVGHCDDMPAAYLLADLAIAPSLEPEAFGRTAVEPQVMGRPVMAADHGATRETVLPGETGWLVTPGDAEAWAAALLEAIDIGASGRQSMGRTARVRARRLYSVDAMCEATLKVYAQVLGLERSS
ncbi:glycosyltransferase [Caulobacter vibrioides]|uniref:Glycosyltransferase n=1 Tax=Caulobacter vibrioides (strain NA1000 / CB15N) TaxID=565050 RepID=A0A0H3C8N1_CAUVN|nr:glycosyltransferase family 4 protein [Caulobacter vibrioides]YP_002516477.1 glycosyltransferase [Caulobacter vibrioides NA1000]ACL94569.1 glycosyltransferase [Caulobacter vibrioides NA1000]ATC24001.1 glycosyl transferase [Caulobacter vibrioides]ATC27883.1 glycosyl transferase [Caulobacter vibrioides]AZH12247.1 glycosyltransferase [Caulobacter vibrioides]PLR10553.1 glycosyl transferase [Caulobacter vibrioides]